MNNGTQMETYLRASQLVKERYVPFSAPTLWRKVKDGSFPAPLKFNGMSAWPLSVIRAWQQQISGGAEQEAA
ncbi:hypothetical protein IST455A_00992 [Burkholderia multivorans]|uniref:helix-turn-helix transcriptional regulator n=1 Tax=Burkholderia multivorans TaxID=87883 RepID=UPI001239F06B|nr:AlpA family transcriptional regulator [Burkholderia multivorans]MBU9247676.1 hypothetical protein [Burkholderia multivorans]QET31699.1 AlpA family transcriptional regulator [Burkholderia multivorans]QET40881.1 AlpA family transcriptional regulator [Burkholderia multivorans]CAB5280185.1 hypothetical protein IST495A_03490 [Burkholderia multivorans]CAB5300523.1 hypothetical protein IST419_01119 [Burkholderia multivorans]